MSKLRRILPAIHLTRRRMRIRAGSWFSLRWIGYITLISAAVTGTVFLAMQFIAPPTTIAVIEGRTEILNYRTFNPQLSSFSTNGFRVAYAGNYEIEDECIQGTFVPSVSTLIEYTRQADDHLTINVEGNGQIRSGSQITEINGSLGLYADPECGPTSASKLPVWGPGQIGNAFTVRSDGIGPVLLSGNLSVFGRTLDLGILGTGGALYSATARPLALPPGGWIRTDDVSPSNDAEVSSELTALFGFLAVDGNAFQMSLSTETPLLQVVAPGGRLEPGRIEIGMFAQILNDPNVLRLQLAVLIFFFLLPVITDLVSFAVSQKGRPHEK